MELMRWAYCYFYATAKQNSVQRKVQQQITGLNKSGNRCEGIFFTFENEGSIEDETIKFHSVGEYPQKLFPSIRAKNESYRALNLWISANYDNYDIIYLRYAKASRILYKIASKYGDKIGIEYQTKDIEEVRSFYEENQFGIRPSKLLSWLQEQFLPIWNEKIWGRLILGKIKFLVGVTAEIANYQTERTIGKRPAQIVLGNGINVAEVKKRTAPAYDGKNLRMILLIGSSPGSSWYGVERILSAIEQYQGEENIELLVCGNVNSSEYSLSKAIQFLGYKSATEIDLLMDSVHIAFGGFAFDKIKLTEGSTLKLREYTARGIPFVYGHSDADIDPLVGMGLAFKFGSEEALDMKKVGKFASEVYKNAAHADMLNAFATKYLDYSVKMKKLSEQVDIIVGKGKGAV